MIQIEINPHKIPYLEYLETVSSSLQEVFAEYFDGDKSAFDSFMGKCGGMQIFMIGTLGKDMFGKQAELELQAVNFMLMLNKHKSWSAKSGNLKVEMSSSTN